MTRNRIAKIPARCAHNALEREVRAWINHRAADYADGWQGVVKDLFHGGCASGIVSGLIYHNECESFARKHVVDILEAMEEYSANTGENPAPNRDAGMSLDATWLAWFGFEQAARRVVDRMEQDEDMASDPGIIDDE